MVVEMRFKWHQVGCGGSRLLSVANEVSRSGRVNVFVGSEVCFLIAITKVPSTTALTPTSPGELLVDQAVVVLDQKRVCQLLLMKVSVRWSSGSKARMFLSEEKEAGFNIF